MTTKPPTEASKINANQFLGEIALRSPIPGLVWRRGSASSHPPALLIFSSLFVLCRIITFTGKILYNFLGYFFPILIIKAKTSRILPVCTKVAETLASRPPPAVPASDHSVDLLEGGLGLEYHQTGPQLGGRDAASLLIP